MTNEVFDLRSDTVTKPTREMRAAMAGAEVGDDVYGEDPTVNELQERVARLLGKEAALWVPTGTLANQLCIGALVGPGDEIVCERDCHVVNYEGGAISAVWGAQALVIDGPRGIFEPAALRAVLRRSTDDHYPLQRAVALENTHNRGGGSIWPLEQMQAVSKLARAEGLAVHLDGARLWNAHVASGVSLQAYGACADTVSVCLSKGLGAPAGSVVASTKERVRLMRRLRKRLGGGMRQVGVLAAAGLYALDHHVRRLAEDHDNARKLAQGLAQVRGLACDPAAVATNLLLVEVDLPGGAAALQAAARAEGVLCNEVNERRIRLVTHLDIPAAAIAEVASRVRRAAERLRG